MTALPESITNAIDTLCRQFDAPFFVYDLDRFEQHIKQLAKADVKLWYAVKANPLSKVIQVLANNGFNFDVASVGELNQVLAQGVAPERILNTGPAKSPKQLSYFLQQGVRTYVVESIGQLNDLNALAAEVDFTPQVLLRVQLRWDEEDGRHNPLGGCAVTPFGMSAEDWLAIDLDELKGVEVKGLHIFQWGNVLSAQRLSELWQAMSEPLNGLADKLGLDYQVLDLGGGLGIAYDDESQALDWRDVETALAQAKSKTYARSLWMELGRYAIGQFGYYVCPVVEQKHNSGQHQLIMAGGVNHLMRPAIAGQAFPATLKRQSDAALIEQAVYGPLCTGLDKLGVFDLPADIGANDHLIFSQCGAYGFTESMPFFLCHTLPGEAVVYQGQIEVLREAQDASSWLR